VKEIKIKSFRHSILSLLLFLALVFAANHVNAGTNPNPVQANQRPAHWAEPLSKPGLKNFFKVSDDLYRGAKPEPEGFQELKKLGIKTVVNLETFHSDREKIEESGSGLVYEHLFMKAWHAEDEDIVRFLKIVTAKTKTPVFVHCFHGSDRTGTMIAMYRIFIQGWSKAEALRELKEGGYGFHPIWKNLETYLKNLDVAKIKKEAGLS
jgi:protein tyrosine/serine phosphatase